MRRRKRETAATENPFTLGVELKALVTFRDYVTLAEYSAAWNETANDSMLGTFAIDRQRDYIEGKQVPCATSAVNAKRNVFVICSASNLPPARARPPSARVSPHLGGYTRGDGSERVQAGYDRYHDRLHLSIIGHQKQAFQGRRRLPRQRRQVHYPLLYKQVVEGQLIGIGNKLYHFLK